MSWLNTASIASLAKSALKEAQKTIDKALDIKENVAAVSPANNSGKEIENFFLSFGMGSENEQPQNGDVSEAQSSGLDKVVVNEPSSKVEAELIQITSLHLTGEGDEAEGNECCGAKDQPKIPAAHLELPLQPNAPDPRGELDSHCAEQVVDFTSQHCQSVAHPFSRELSVGKSCNSSFSTSTSSATVTSSYKENQSVESCSQPDEGDGALPSGLNDCRTSEEVLISTALSEAMRDSSKTENSASLSSDEVETTTSSDIEIIASPQGGIRSTLQLAPFRGIHSMTHHREPSEASSEDSVTSAMETDKIGRNVTELNHLLEAREIKLMCLNRTCVALTEEVEDLKTRLALDSKDRLSTNEMIRRQKEDFALRLSAVEKRYQQVLAERDALLVQLDGVKGYDNLEKQIAEKEEIITELRLEGEKLSKTHLQQSNIIKKLRSKEKENEQQLKQVKEKNEELAREVERLRKCLVAREESEKNQTEQVRHLSNSNSQMEKELLTNKMVIRDAFTEIESLRKTLLETERELQELRTVFAEKDFAIAEHNLSVEVSLRQQLQADFDEFNRIKDEEHQALTHRCQELASELAQAESCHAREREQAKYEICRLMQRYQEAEARSDELSQALTTATKPLLRQIETLQSALSSQRSADDKSEQILTEKLHNVERQLQSAYEKDVATKDAYAALQTRTSELSERLAFITQENHNLSVQLAKATTVAVNVEENRSTESSHRDLRNERDEEIHSLREKLLALEKSFELQAGALEEEKAKVALLEDRCRQDDANATWKTARSGPINPTAPDGGGTPVAGNATMSRGSSPTPSLDKLSLSGSLTESHTSNPWLSTSDDVFESNSLTTPVPKSTLYDAMRTGSYTIIFESLQSQLKTRDGELQQLQQELQNRENTRDALAQELANLISSNQELLRHIEQLQRSQAGMEDLKTKYDALLQMYGEKIEENEELRLDLEDVKEMYKIQIDQLMKK